MDQTVELVNRWADFKTNYPDGTIEEFCRFAIIKQRERQSGEAGKKGHAGPTQPKQILGKLMGRITKLLMSYAEGVMQGTGVNSMDEFQCLSAIFALGTPKKTEAINYNFLELSTGLIVLGNLIKMGLVTEHNDPNDRRSKRLKITAKGEKVLFKCYEQLTKLSSIMFGHMPDEDVLLCIQLLNEVDTKFSGLWAQHKGKPFKEIYSEMVASSTSPSSPR